MNLVRLNKYIAESGICSRRNADELINEGRISVNGKVIKQLGIKINPDSDIIKYDGERIEQKNKVYFLLNKPKGYITTVRDDKNRPTVLSLIRTNERIFPVGRLDIDTTGVLILTNDGNFSNKLIHPKNKVPKEYEVELLKPLNKDYLKYKSVELEDGITEIDFMRFIDFNPKRVLIRLHEGKNHVVKRIFKKFNNEVVRLHRKSFAGLNVENLQIGKYRKLSYIEAQKLLNKYGLKVR